MGLAATPRLPRDVLDRPRLRAAIDADGALVVLRAPAGFGKTVALAQWARATDAAGLWFRPEEGGEDPMAFVGQLGRELTDAGAIGERNPLANAAEVIGVGAHPWDLLRRGLRAMPGPFRLVIDESDRLSEATLEGLLSVLADLPSLSVRAATRGSSPLTEEGLAVVLDASVIDAAELLFTRAEAAAVLGIAEDDPALDRAMGESGGIPVVTRLLALGGGAQPGAVERSVASLLRMRRSHWEPRFERFLERASLAESVDRDLAEELAGQADADALLDLAEREGLGLWSGAGEDGAQSFVLSPVVRDALERRLRETTTPQELRALTVAVARAELRRDRPFPALRRALEVREWALVNDIVREHWFALLGNGAQLRELFAPVPAASLRNQPLVSMLLAIVYNATRARRLRALEYFALAAYGARVRRARASSADRVLLRTVETAAHRVSGRGDAALHAARDAYAMLAAMSVPEREQLGRNEAAVYNHVGLSLFYGGATEEALDCFRRSLAVGDARGLRAGLVGLGLEAGVLAIEGDVVDAEARIVEAHQRPWPDLWLDGYNGSFLRLAAALVALERFDADAADAELRVLDPHRETIEHWAPLLQADVMVDLLRGRIERARARMDSTIRHQRRRQAASEPMMRQLRLTRALVELAAGDVRAAEQQLARTTAGADRAVALARAALVRGDPDAALGLLQQTDAAAPSGSRLRAEHAALTAASLSLLRESGGAQDAVDALRRLHALLDDRGLAMPLALVPAAGLEAMARVAGEAGLDPAFTGLLSRAASLRVLAARTVRPRLTEREAVIARELASARTVPQIAARLSVSPNTIKTQLRSLYRKLGVSTRTDAVRALAASGVVPPDQDEGDEPALRAASA